MARIGLQLYTVKDEAEKDLLGTVRAAARMGYDGVEFSGFFGLAAREIRAVLNGEGIAVAGAMIDLPELERNLDRTVDYCLELGCSVIIVPGVDESRRTDADGFSRLGGIMTSIGHRSRERGLRLLYHVHGYEFVKFGEVSALDVMLAHLAPGIVELEADVYWIEHAGVDALTFLRTYGARCPYLHLKDMKDRQTSEDTEVGAGCIDIAGVVREGLRYGAKWFVVEQEQFAMPTLASAAISLGNVRRLIAAQAG